MTNTNTTRTLAKAITFTALTLTFAASANAQDWNPVIWDGGKRVTGISYDPFSGRLRIKTDHRKVRESALDPNRSNIDPGSFEYVNEYQTDNQGRRWHVTGTRWTSNGVPHGNLNRRRVSGVGGGIDHDENENVVYSAGNRSKNTSKTKNRPQPSAKKSTWTRHQTRGKNTSRYTPTKKNYSTKSYSTKKSTNRKSAQRYNPF